jgi:hypothetical protein
VSGEVLIEKVRALLLRHENPAAWLRRTGLVVRAMPQLPPTPRVCLLDELAAYFTGLRDTLPPVAFHRGPNVKADQNPF